MDQSIDLRIPEDGEVILPPEVFTRGFSFEELGAIAYWIALAQGTVKADCSALVNDQDSVKGHKTIKRLFDKGILFVRREESKMVLGVDLESWSSSTTVSKED